LKSGYRFIFAVLLGFPPRAIGGIMDITARSRKITFARSRKITFPAIRDGRAT
jgi:hypothetical protein